MPDNFAVSLSWSALIPGKTFVGIRDFNYSSNWEEFREATRKFHVPAQNLLYADRDGNIAYQSPGKLPIRKEGLYGDLPIEGWFSENDWQGFVVFEDLPYSLNPSSGYIITANQSVHPDQPWPNYYARGYRAKAIERVINQYMINKISVDDMQAMQIDNFDYSAAYVLPYVFNNVYSDGAAVLENELAIRFTTESPANYVAPLDVEPELSPNTFLLEPAYPNPFNPVTNFNFMIPFTEKVSLNIYDILGRNLINLHNGILVSGQYRFSWDGQDKRGHVMSTGTYFLVVEYGESKHVQKLLLLK